MTNPLNDAETFKCDQDNLITNIGNHPNSLEEIEGQYIGLLKFTGKGWSWAREIIDSMDPRKLDKLQMTKLLSRLIDAGYPVVGLEVDGNWVEVDSEQDLEVYESKLLNRPVGVWHHDWRI